MRIQQPFRQAHSSPATSPYTREAKIRRLPRESTYNKERPLRRERPHKQFYFCFFYRATHQRALHFRENLFLRKIFPRGARSFIAPTASAANLRALPITTSASMRVCPAGTNGGPQRRETLLAEEISERASAYRATHQRALHFRENLFLRKIFPRGARSFIAPTASAANLRALPITTSASMRVCPAGTNGGPQRRETLLAEEISERASAYRATHQRALPSAEVAVMQ